ncbi:MAG: FAD-dependent oxidoreductase, partial [Psychroflexus sp.]|nr:FAD-dependent oxidoreductase [Psychroflexus sp.]
TKEIAIIGAGMSGLVAAHNLESAGYNYTVYEDKDRVGGRLKTDYREGLQFDHGFQILMTAYPAVQKYLNLELLHLEKFISGAKIFKNKNVETIGDPRQDLSLAFSTLKANIGSFADKRKILKLSRTLKNKTLDAIFHAEEKTTLQYLIDYDFSEQIIADFFKPFFAGIFLEENLETSSRHFEFIYKMLSSGDVALPKKGIQAIPNQIYAQLNHENFDFNRSVSSIKGQTIDFENGDQKSFDYIIIATDASRFLSNLKNQAVLWHQVENFYFKVDQKVYKKNFIGLMPIDCIVNNFNYCNTSTDLDVLSVSVVRQHDYTKEELIEKIKHELLEHAGMTVTDCLKYYKIQKALPQMVSVNYMMPASETQLTDHVFLAGDHLSNASLNSAMLNGESAAQAIIQKIKNGIINI